MLINFVYTKVKMTLFTKSNLKDIDNDKTCKQKN